MKKYSDFLTFLAILLAIIATLLIVYFLYMQYDNYITNKEAGKLMDQFEQQYEEDNNTDNIDDEEEPPDYDEEPTPTEEVVTQTPTKIPSSNKNSNTYQTGTFYKGYKIIGIISIPKLNIQYPIFDTDNTTTLKVGTAAIYPSKVEEALNKPGNAVIAGHNYRSSKMFSKLTTLNDGDSIFITDISGQKLEYKVYNNYTADESDFSYATRATNGATEISLTTCTTNSKTRTVVWAKVD